MGRKRRRSSPTSPSPSSVERSPPATRSRSRAARSGTSTPSGMAPTVPQEVESSGSRSTRRSYSARRPRGMPASAAAPSSPEVAAAGDSIGAQLVTPEPASASTAGGEELTAPASPAGGEEVEPMLEPEDTAAAGAFLPNYSPLRMPYLLEQDSNGQLCEEQSPDPDPVLMEPYRKAEKEYFDKIAQITKLPTLDSDTATSPNIIQESEADTILKASEFVLGLSSYIDGELLRNCSGILMEWSKGTGTILTTSQLICSRSPNVDEWLGGDEYALNAEVRVQLLHKDDFGKGELMYLDKQYGFALFRVLMDEPKKLPRFSNERFAQDVFLLGRYELNLQIGNGKVLSKGAGKFQHHHYMYTDGHISPFGAGGAVINFEGDVTGMITSSIHFIPSSIIRKCLEIWRTYSHVPRIHLGMKLLGIKCLNLVSKEKISRKYNVDAGLIVKEVSAESNAEKLGVRMGDIILSVNGEVIATAVELESKLLDISKALLEKGIVPGSGVDVTLALGVFNSTKCARGRILLRAKLSNDEEIIEEGKYNVIYKRPNVAAPGVVAAAACAGPRHKAGCSSSPRAMRTPTTWRRCLWLIYGTLAPATSFSYQISERRNTGSQRAAGACSPTRTPHAPPDASSCSSIFPRLTCGTATSSMAMAETTTTRPAAPGGWSWRHYSYDIGNYKLPEAYRPPTKRVIPTVAAFQVRFYFINSFTDMCAIDFTSSKVKGHHPAFHYFDARKVDFPKGMCFGKAWLLDCDDQLFLVDVSCVGVEPHNIGAVRVYKMDFSLSSIPSSKPPRWRRVRDTGDAVFLLEDTGLATSCPASLHGLKRNQVYFMKNFVEDDADLCIFDLESECQEITRVHHHDGLLLRRNPFWILPPS